MASDDGDLTHIDGSVLEGGGQILRNAAALSALLLRPISISRIRAGRQKPGLRAQHSCGIQLLADICSAECSGSSVGSTELRIRPRGIKCGTFRCDTGTAGSVCLVAQAALPVLAFAGGASELELRGGTNADFAPPVDHFADAFRHAAARFGLNFELSTQCRGFFPQGGGQSRLTVQPVTHLRCAKLLQQGKVSGFRGCAFACGAVPAKAAERMRAAAAAKLAKAFPDVGIDIRVEAKAPAVGSGCGICLFADTDSNCVLGASCLGKRGVPAEQVAAEAADCLLRDLKAGACLDEHTQDQVILLMSLAKGDSAIRCGQVTLHTRTAVHVAELLTGAKFHIEEDSTAGSSVISCTGIGLTNPHLPADSASA